jgi:hypothetical protein
VGRPCARGHASAARTCRRPGEESPGLLPQLFFETRSS